MTMPSIRVIIADDHPVVVSGLLTLFSTTSHLGIVEVVRAFSELHERLAQTPADVLVLDIGGMGGAPLTLVTGLRRQYPALKIVIFSSSIDLAPELFRAGVQGYVAKEELPRELLAAIDAVHAGSNYRSPVVQNYMDRVERSGRQVHLAPQELSVLKLLAQGMGTEAIAGELHIKPSSVQNYITALKRKTGSRERTQLVDWYRRVYRGDSEEQT